MRNEARVCARARVVFVCVCRILVISDTRARRRPMD